MEFNAKQVKDQVVQWIRDWFEVNGKGCNAVIGISGGKDSSVVAALCAEALGKDRVIGVTMPNGVQPDIDDSMKLINHLGIRYCCVNIGDTYNTLIAAVKEQLGTLDAEVSRQTTINLPPRLRMSTLYAVSQSMNGRVANTCNLSEDWVGYSTRYGDAAGDFAPLGGLTVQEVKAIGKELGLPIELVVHSTMMIGVSCLASANTSMSASRKDDPTVTGANSWMRSSGYSYCKTSVK